MLRFISRLIAALLLVGGFAACANAHSTYNFDFGGKTFYGGSTWNYNFNDNWNGQFTDWSGWNKSYGGSSYTVWTSTKTLDHTSVPEPATLALFGAGLLGLGLVRRKRNKGIA